MKLKVALLLAGTFVLYASLLERSPIYLNNDETVFALQARAIAFTAHDESGRFLPLYFQIVDTVWYHPVIVYVLALFLRVLPLTEAAVRLPTAILAVVNVALIVLVAKRIFKSDRIALTAGALLALTPAHFIHGRLACDYLYPVPFILTWLLCLAAYLERPRLWVLFAAGLALGIGFYSYIASVVMMPVYVLLTWVVLATRDPRPWRSGLAVAAGFLMPLTLLVNWLIRYPATFYGATARYHVQDQLQLGVATIVWQRALLYFKFFDPWFLFVRGGGAVTSSTHRAGVFALSMMVLLPIGLYEILRHRRAPLTLVVAAGFVTAPFAATFINEPYTIDRALAFLPFGALIAAAGVDRLLSARTKAVRMAAIVLLALIPLQFAFFYADYLTAYRVRSAFWFNGNNRGALEEIIAAAPPGSTVPVYLSENIPFIHFYWKLYLLKHHREDLLARTVFFTLENLHVDALPPDHIVLTNVDDGVERALIGSGRMKRVKIIGEPDGMATFARLERASRP